MKKERYQYYKEKYNLPTVLDEDEIEGKVISKYIDGNEYSIILFKDNTCFVLNGTSYDYVEIKDEDSIYEEDFIRDLRDEFPECYAEFENERKAAWQEEERKRRYEQYLKLKNEFE